jgi:hypothetical protein
MFDRSTPAVGKRPRAVVGAVALLVVEAIAGAASVHVLFSLAPSSKGWELPFQPGVWLLALLQVLLALFVLRGSNVARWVVTAVVVLLVGDSLLNTSLSARFRSFPAATLRDLCSYALQVTAVALLFLPASSLWFRNTAHSKRAA